MQLTVEKFQRLKGHPFVRATAEVCYGGVCLRGLRLEERGGDFSLGFPGRKVRQAWQVLFELRDPELADGLRDLLAEHYREAR